jgi:hypothetical protein
LDEEDRVELRRIRSAIVGPLDQVGENKPKTGGKGGLWYERVDIERNSQSGKGGRTYSLSVTHQDPKDLEAVYKGRKIRGRDEDEHDRLTFDLLWVIPVTSTRREHY